MDVLDQLTSFAMPTTRSRRSAECDADKQPRSSSPFLSPTASPLSCPPRRPFPPRHPALDPPAPPPPDDDVDALAPLSLSDVLPYLLHSTPAPSAAIDSSDDNDDDDPNDDDFDDDHAQLVHDPVRIGGANGKGRQYVCNVGECGKSFSRKSDLARHHRIHANDRPFKCTFPRCGKAFIQRSALTVHHRTHTGERPHKCQECPRAFSDSSSLARHRRIHSGARPYACQIYDCGRSFARRNTYLFHHKKAHPDVTPPKCSIPRSRSALAPILSTGALDNDGRIYFATPATSSTPHGFAAPHPSEVAAHSDNGGHSGQIFGGATELQPSIALSSQGGAYRAPNFPSAPDTSLLTPLSASTTNSDFAETQRRTEGSTVISRTSYSAPSRGQAQQAQGNSAPISEVSAQSGSYPHDLGYAQYPAHPTATYPLTRFASDSGSMMHTDRSSLTVGPRSLSNPMDPPRFQAYVPNWGNVGGGFHASQLSIPQHSQHLTPSYYSTAYPQRSLSGRPLPDPVSPSSNPEEYDEPLVSISDAPTFAVHPPSGPTMAYPMSAVDHNMYATNSQHQYHPQVLHATMQYDRMHSAPPAVNRFHSLPSAPNMGSWTPQPQMTLGHNHEAQESHQEEDWDNLLSREASIGEDEQVTPAIIDSKPLADLAHTTHWEAPIPFPVPPMRESLRYPFSSSASSSSTSSTLVAPSNFGANLSNTLPPISTWAQNSQPMPMVLTPINPNAFYPTPVTPANGWNNAHAKSSNFLDSPMLFKPWRPQQPDPMPEQENDRIHSAQNITLITPPNKWQLDERQELKPVASVGLGIANVQFEDRSNDIIMSKEAVEVNEPEPVNEWEEGEEELISEPEPDDDSDDDYVVGRKAKKAKKGNGRRGGRGSVASKSRRK